MSCMLSVIMPAWNRANVISDALKSLADQDAGPIELCLVDDGSTDDTEAVVRDFFEENDTNIVLKYHKIKHAGVSAARNAALQLATSDIIAYLDSDNIWMPNFVSSVVAFFEKNKNCKAAYGRLLFLNREKEPHFTLSFPYDRSALLYQNFIDMNVFVHRRSCLEKYGCFDTNLRQGVDWDLVIRFTQDEEPMVIAETLCHYCVSGPSNRISDTENMKNTMRQIIGKHLREIDALGLTQQIMAGHPHRHATLVQPEWDIFYRQILTELHTVEP